MDPMDGWRELATLGFAVVALVVSVVAALASWLSATAARDSAAIAKQLTSLSSTSLSGSTPPWESPTRRNCRALRAGNVRRTSWPSTGAFRSWLVSPRRFTELGSGTPQASCHKARFHRRHPNSAVCAACWTIYLIAPSTSCRRPLGRCLREAWRLRPPTEIRAAACFQPRILEEVGQRHPVVAFPCPCLVAASENPYEGSAEGQRHYAVGRDVLVLNGPRKEPVVFPAGAGHELVAPVQARLV